MPSKRNRTKNTKKVANLADKQKIAQLTKQVQLMKLAKTKKPTPFSDTGGMIGKAAGGLFGRADLGSSIGRWLGSGIGSIFGSGDYTMTGTNPSYNVLTNSKQIPQFSSTHATNIVCHREYLGDIQGTSSFNNIAYPLNPGLSQTFPWLSTVAENYQEYKFHGLVFEFRPLITDFVTSGAPGVVVMATNYNADSPTYLNKQQMENSEFAVSVKPTTGLMHGVECEMAQTILPQRYVRAGAVPIGQDLRLYDYGSFQFATQSNPVQNLGELWVSYCVEFFKPVLPIGGGSTASGHFYKAGVSTVNPVGTGPQLQSSGTITISTTGTTFTFTVIPSARYLVTVMWNVAAAAITLPTSTVSGNAATFNLLQNDTAGFNSAPSVAATTSTTGVQVTALLANTVGGSVTFTYAGANFPGGTVIDVVVSQLDSSTST